MARPRKDPAEQRRHRISYTVTDGELAVLQDRARRHGTSSVHRFARDLALRRQVRAAQPMAFPFDVAKELRSIGVNLNQQTRRLHVTGHVTPELRAVWAKLDGLLSWVIDHGSARRQNRQ